jgi:hypothetical protein
MGKTRNGHLVKNQYAEDEFCLDDYYYKAEEGQECWEPNDYVEGYCVASADAEYYNSQVSIKTSTHIQQQPKAWDGVMRKNEKRLPKTYKALPSLVTLAVDALPMRQRAELPVYFPGSLDYLRS